MRQFLSLPTSLLFLIASSPSRSSSQELQWPYNLPHDARYFPEDEAFIRRDIEIGQELLHKPAVGVRKMSEDEGEKFFMEYWQFGMESDTPILDQAEDAVRAARQRLRPGLAQEDDCPREWANSSVGCAPRPSFPLHSDTDPSLAIPFFRRRFRLPRALDTRSFQCPVGTSACPNNPNSCCETGETCQTIVDTGLGTIGCCAAGASCSGQLSGGCDTSQGLTACPNNPGGGCCIPGYRCLDVGCVYISTATVHVTPKTSTTSSSSSTSSPPPRVTTSTSTVVVPAPLPPTSTSSRRTTPTTSTPRPPSTCTSGFQSCPASFGGGCCATDPICTTNRLCVDTTSTSTRTSITTTTPLAPPLRPTSNSDVTIPGATCPTGFYACEAYYRGGCCRTGRNCETTSCPPTSSTTLVDTHSVTAVAPMGSGISANQGAPTGSCPGGWSTCAGSIGGGCCPTGCKCGTAACTATASRGQSATMGKIAPNGAEGRGVGKRTMRVAGVVALAARFLLS